MTQFKSIFTALSMAAASVSSAAIAQEASASLSLTFTGIETMEGKVMGVLVDSEAAYDGKAAPVRPFMITADKSEIAAQLQGLKPGRYAIKSFHDVDGDNKMSTNPFGMPTEPFAFSNDAKGAMGPASWADASFEIKAGANTHRITIK